MRAHTRTHARAYAHIHAERAYTRKRPTRRHIPTPTHSPPVHAKGRRDFFVIRH